MANKDKNDLTPKGGGVPSRKVLYSKVASHLPKAIATLVKLLDSRNEAVQTGAAKALLDRGLPVLRSQEIVGKDGEQLTVNIISDYISTGRGSNGSPVGGSKGQDKVQDPGVAQESKKDINSTGEDSNGST